MPDRRQQRQRRDVGLRIDRDIEIRLIAELVARAEARADRALAAQMDEGVHVEMVRPATHLRRLEAAPEQAVTHVRQQAVRVGVPQRQRGERLAQLLDGIARAERDHVVRHVVGQRCIKPGHVQSPRRKNIGEPRSHLGLGTAIQRKRLRRGAERDERQIGNPQTEPRAARHGVGDQAAELIVPCEIGVGIAGLRSNVGARRAGEPLRAVMRRQPRVTQLAIVRDGNVLPARHARCITRS